ncbi:MAG TPA: hypothetical protein VFB88_08685 [Xanthobacteraceae bacterium]|nr:hypothetical protein [Xanthobacteraceae bacterium]
MIVSQAPLPVNQGTVVIVKGNGVTGDLSTTIRVFRTAQEPARLTPAEAATFIKGEIQRWGEVIRSNNIVAERKQRRRQDRRAEFGHSISKRATAA